MDAKFKCMADAMDAVDKTRQEKTVEALRMGLQEILSLAGFSCKDAVCDVIDQADAVDVNKEGEDGEGESELEDDDDDSDSGDAESGCDAHGRLAGYFASSSAATTAASEKRRRRPSRRALAPAHISPSSQV